MAEKQEDDGATLAVLGFALLALVVILFVPTLLAFIVWVLVRNYFTRREYFVVLLAGVVAWAISFAEGATGYVTWLWNAVRGDFEWAAFPVLPVLATAAVLLGLLGLLSGTRVAERLPGAFRKSIPKERETILPTNDEKRRVSSVAAVPGGIAATPSSPSKVTVKQDPGNRAFTIAVDGNGQPVQITESEMRTHGMILGATGSGKTEAIKVFAGGLMDLGWSGMILDLKEDSAPGGLRDWCSTYAQYHAMPFQELRLSVPVSETWFNPLADMGPDEARDTILALQEFDDAYWQALNKNLLGQVVNLFYWAHQADPSTYPAPTMYDIGKLLSEGSLASSTKKMRAVVDQMIPGVTKDDLAILANPSPDMQKSATGYGSKLTMIYDTQAGRTVLRPGGEKRVIDVTSPGLTYVGLDSQGKADLTKVISSAMLQRMSVYAAQRVTGQTGMDASKPRFLIVDEANWVNRTIVQNLLSRARSAGIAMVLCTQGPKDWVDEQGDDWGKLTQNVNVAVIMSQGEPESAEMCADYIGKQYKKQHSEMIRQQRGLVFDKPIRDRMSGDFLESHSVREELVHIVDPDDLRRLSVGEGVLRVGKPSERITWMRMFMRDPTTTLSAPR